MKTIRRLKIETIIRDLKEIRRASTFEHSHFDDIGDKGVTLKESEITKFIQKRINLYCSSWLTEPLDRVITLLVNELNGKRP